MNGSKQEITLFDAVTPVAVTSSTDATPIVVSATAHGFSTGDRVLIFGHTTNLAANGIFKVINLTSGTFSLVDEFTGASVAGSGGGAGSSGVCMKAPPVVLISEMKNVILQLGTSSTATLTAKLVGSLGLNPTNQSSPRWDYPNMGATIAPSNPYSFVQCINLDDGSTVNGSTGVVVAGTDINKMYEVNINALKYLTLIPVTWSAGKISAKLLINTAM